MLLATDVSALFPEAPPQPAGVGQVLDFPIAELWLDDQPRQIVPEATLQRLIAEDRAQPHILLRELKAIAAVHQYYRGILDGIEDLARTIRADGVLEPLLAIEKDDRHVLRDGHRRSLASLIAEKTTVPVRIVDESSALQAATRQLVLNIQREDLTALERGRWMLRLARLVEEELRAAQELERGVSVVDALVSNGTGDDDDPEPRRGASPEERALAAAVREQVCALTGLRERHYYNLLYLNRLTPEAREAGLGLTEGQLRPVTSVPPSEQADMLRFIAGHKLTSKEAASLVKVARSGDRDAVRRVMAKLAREDLGRQRATVSWEPLMHALPRDLWARCAALRAELEALAPERRDVRLRAIWEQHRLAEELSRTFADILALYAYAGPGAGDSLGHNDES